jgi:hypothetical protein
MREQLCGLPSARGLAGKSESELETELKGIVAGNDESPDGSTVERSGESRPGSRDPVFQCAYYGWTISLSCTVLTPGAAHTANSASLRSRHD